MDNGVIIKDVDLPASFGDLTGVVATKDIPSNTVKIYFKYTGHHLCALNSYYLIREM